MAGSAPATAGHRQDRKVPTAAGSAALTNASAGLANRAGQAASTLGYGPAYSTSTLPWLVKIGHELAVSAHLTSAGRAPAPRSAATRAVKAGWSSSDATCTMKPDPQAMSARGPPIGSRPTVVVATVVTVLGGGTVPVADDEPATDDGLGSPLLPGGTTGTGRPVPPAGSVPVPLVAVALAGGNTVPPAMPVPSPATGRSRNHTPAPAASSTTTASATRIAGPRRPRGGPAGTGCGAVGGGAG